MEKEVKKFIKNLADIFDVDTSDAMGEDGINANRLKGREEACAAMAAYIAAAAHMNGKVEAMKGILGAAAGGLHVALAENTPPEIMGRIAHALITIGLHYMERGGMKAIEEAGNAFAESPNELDALMAFAAGASARAGNAVIMPLDEAVDVPKDKLN